MDDSNPNQDAREVNARRHPSGLFCDTCSRLILERVGPNQERPYQCVDCRRRFKKPPERRVTTDQGVDSGAVDNAPSKPLSNGHLRGMLRDSKNHPVKDRKRGGRPRSAAPSRHARYRRRKVAKMSPDGLSQHRASEVARVRAYRAARAAGGQD
jgi:hypothetical protein